MKTPKVILDLHKHRREVLCLTEEIDTSEPGLSDESIGTMLTGEETKSLNFDEEKEGVKERTNHALTRLYNEKGYNVFHKTALLLKNKGSLEGEKFPVFKGELAEVFIYLTILEFIKVAKVDWTVIPSSVIAHRNGQQGAVTEIDLILVSEEVITVFEVKSYNGVKTLSDICTLEVKGGKTLDIYKQNALHCESLLKQIKEYNLSTNKGMKSVLFSFANGSITDKRDEKSKKLIPVLDENNLIEYLMGLLKLKNKHWVPEINQKVKEVCSIFTQEDHKKYRNYK